MGAQALAGLKVVDVSRDIAGPYCTKLLSDMGADVIKVEQPGKGDPTRYEGPFPNDEPDLEASALFAFLNSNKRSVTLDLKAPEGGHVLEELVNWADVLVESFSPGVMAGLGLGYDQLAARNPRLVMTSITPFGQTGSFSNYQATELCMHAWICHATATGDPAREGYRAFGPARYFEYSGGVFAAAQTLATSALGKSGRGAHLDVSLVEAAFNAYPVRFMAAQFNGVSPWVEFIPTVEECKDGYVAVAVLTGQHWQDLCHMMGVSEWAEDPKFTTANERYLRKDEFRARIRPWLMARTVKEVVAEAGDWRIPAAPVNDAKTLLEWPQFVEREYFIEVEHPKLGNFIQPGAPFRLSKTPWAIRRPAPLLGQHNEEIYGGLLGYDAERMKDLAAGKTI